jgi:hypothetical protein
MVIFCNIFYIFLCSDCTANVQEQEQKGAETTRLSVELEQARQQIKALQQVLSRCYCFRAFLAHPYFLYVLISVDAPQTSAHAFDSHWQKEFSRVMQENEESSQQRDRERELNISLQEQNISLQEQNISLQKELERLRRNPNNGAQTPSSQESAGGGQQSSFTAQIEPSELVSLIDC